MKMQQLVCCSLHPARRALIARQQEERAFRKPYCILWIEEIQYGSKYRNY